MKAILLVAIVPITLSLSEVSAATGLDKSGQKETVSSLYTVKPGDGLEKIARKHGCSRAALMTANGLKPTSIIHPGQKLKIPGSATSRPSGQVAAARPGPTQKTHTVREGDTYYKISSKYGVSVDSLIAANPRIKPTALRPGQVIRLSASQAPTASAPPAAPSAPLASAPAKPAPAPVSNAPAESREEPLEIAEHPPASPSSQESVPAGSEQKIRSVTIEGEMTYAEFAAKHGTDVDRLNNLNGLDLTKATVLAKGSELYVPAQP